MNNKVLVCTGSLWFFKKYWQPIIKFWSVLVPVRRTVHFKIQFDNNFEHVSNGTNLFMSVELEYIANITLSYYL